MPSTSTPSMMNKKPFKDMAREAMRQRLVEVSASGPCNIDSNELSEYMVTASILVTSIHHRNMATPVHLPSSALPLLL